MSEHKYTNALAGETSPYLLQHAHNPVSWYPWCEKALRLAREGDKPILLSIGYSACHWCHVMEHESFEDEETARLMNENFINIKVDREERPDLDSIYMAAVQMMTGSGGWPMTVFLTPDQVPFYAGTYFPPEDRRGLPGFRRVLSSVARAYREKREEIVGNASAVLAQLEQTDSPGEYRQELRGEILDAAAISLTAGYDAQNGGFGTAPKFPPSMALTFLMRRYAATGQNRLLEIVEHTFAAMAGGGIHDQIGGGFHRYSVDRYWLVPHFEKMLYDNALLSRAYLDCYLLTGNPFYSQIATETLDYVLREMTSPEGGFYSSQDADSEGEEGRFYVWTPEEIEAILGAEDAALFCLHYGVSPEGNFEGRNILNVPRATDVTARLCRVSEERLRQAVDRGRRLLFAARETRVKPGRDEKILTAWNGLMLRSFAEAASSLADARYRQAAVRNAEFILSSLMRGGRLLRTYRIGQAKYSAFLEDYACVADGLLSLYEATFDERWFHSAEELADVMIENFWDSSGGGFYFTASDDDKLIRRPKDFHDNATPSGNSAAAYALLRLWRFSGKEKWLRHALPVLENMALPMAKYPSAFSALLSALDFYLSRAREVAIVGDPQAEPVRRLLREVFGRYLPNKVVACGLGSSLPLLRDRPQADHMPTAYVCEDFVCKTPVTDAASLAAQLSAAAFP